jgi:subtilisin family serine protease
MAQGVSTVLSNQFGAIVTANGTSFSGPVMAGMIASFWQAFPTKTNKEIKALIIQSANRFTAPTAQYGYGIPNFSVALTLSVKDLAKNYFMIYPNPTSDYISVRFPESFNKGTVVFYTILGQKVLEREVSSPVDTFSLKSLNNGIYIYKIESDTFSKTGKIIKQ